jgi:hypothetical protein
MSRQLVTVEFYNVSLSVGLIDPLYEDRMLSKRKASQCTTQCRIFGVIEQQSE